MKRKSKILLIFLMLLLFLVGLGITLYPRFQGASVDASIGQDVESFYEWLEEIPPFI